MKFCSKCNEEKSFDLFNKNKTRVDGLQAYCKQCRNIIQKEYRKNNAELVNTKAKIYRNKNKEMHLNALKNYRGSEKGKVKRAFIQMNRKANQLKRTPKWLTEDEKWLIQEAYHLASLRTKATGFQWHVDHVVPMQGALVSGLHCPENLRVIPGVENLTKNNSWCWDTQSQETK